MHYLTLTLPRAVALVFGASALVYLAGCTRVSTELPDGAGQPASAAKATEAKQVSDEEHAHKPGAHGGTLVAIGRDNYHAEAVFEQGGTLRFYTLGKDETRVLEVEDQPLTGYAKAEGAAEATSFVLKAEPQPGDAAGKTSQFVGKLPRELWGKNLEVTIPSVRIGGERFRVGFASAPAPAHDGQPMPAKVASDDERKLYLTPGGKYTEADIRANGGVTASEKFKGLKAEHDLKPAPGMKICPVTLTKANPKFSWVIGGKSYEFCCPPCVDEFVQLAKEHPEQVKEPNAYVK